MNFASRVIGASLLFVNSGVLADSLNGTVQGSIDSHAVNVAVACNRETIGDANWFTADSDPSVRGGVEDRNADGIAIKVSSDSTQAVFEVLIADQRYKFVAGKDAAFSATGVAVKTNMKRYEGKGKDQKVVGEYQVDLTLTCPEA